MTSIVRKKTDVFATRPRRLLAAVVVGERVRRNRRHCGGETRREKNADSVKRKKCSRRQQSRFQIREGETGKKNWRAGSDGWRGARVRSRCRERVEGRYTRRAALHICARVRARVQQFEKSARARPVSVGTSAVCKSRYAGPANGNAWIREKRFLDRRFFFFCVLRSPAASLCRI